MGKEYTTDMVLKLRTLMDVSSVGPAVQSMKSALEKLKLPDNFSSQFGKQFDKIETKIADYQAKLAKNPTSESDFKDLLKDGQAILRLYEGLQSSVRTLGRISEQNISKLLPTSVLTTFREADKLISQFTTTTTRNSKAIEKKNIALENQRKLQGQLTDDQKQLHNQEIIAQEDYDALSKKLETATKRLDELKQKQQDLMRAQDAGEITADASDEQQARLRKQISAAKGSVTKAQNAIAGKVGADDLTKQSADIDRQLDAVAKRIAQITQEISDLEAKNPKALQELIAALSQKLGIEPEKLGDTIESITTALNGMKADAAAEVTEGLRGVGQAAEQADPAVGDFNTKLKKTREELTDFDESAKKTEALKSRIAAFFDASNAVYLFRRAISSAFNSVKELDAIMTETAVVTDFNISDMWEQLPEYTARANELGVTIADTYKAATLFYQQGLKTNEVIGVSNQTLKMARIAGLDATDATNKMTAALRGFNMAVTETNAERVSDVYSELAAITASDVQEISEAMTKTASLASNAGMQFETTAAFLSQIIETTRESAETAGTALKTVIARFQELKKDPAEIGEVDGEIIDANKIETALRTVGVSLRDTNGQFRDLDQVFLDLASKWDGLDTNTQRYIATIAAGSRQQSRFIAMMSDYGRTMELVTAANNAEGAATEQYNKTLDSLQSILNKLQNAWNEYMMGLANQDAIKLVLKALTGILNVLNKITGVLPGIGNSIAKWGVLIGGLKLGGKEFDVLTKSFQGLRKTGIDPVTAALKSLGSVGKDIPKTIANGFTGLFKKGSNTIDPDQLNAAAGYFKDVTEGTLNYDQAIQAVSASCKVTVDQAKAYGVALDIVSDKQQLGTILSNEAVAGKILEIQANKALSKEEKEAAIAKELNNRTTKSGIIYQLARASASTMAALATDVETGATKKNILAKGAAWIANKLVAGSALEMAAAEFFALVPIGLLIGAIILLVAGIYKLVKAAKDNTIEARLARDTEAAKAAQEQAEATKQAYDDLLSKRNEYSDISSELEGLVQGTQEWRDKLLEVNKQVLDLIDAYPELAKWVTVGTSGQLSIDEEGWRQYLDTAQQQVRTSQFNVATKNLKVKEDETEAVFTNELISAIQQLPLEYRRNHNIDYGNIANSKYTHLKGGRYYFYDKYADRNIDAGYEKTTYSGVAQAIISNVTLENEADFFATENNEYSDALQKLASELGYDAELIWYLKDEVHTYNQALENQKTIIAQFQSVLFSSLTSENAKSQYAEQITAFYSKQLDKTSTELIDGFIDSLGDSYKDDARIKELAEKYDIDPSELSSNNKAALKTLYSAITGKTIAQITEEDIDTDTMEKAIASAWLELNYSKKSNKIIQDIASLPEDVREIINYVTQDGADLTSDQAYKLWAPQGFKEARANADAMYALGLTDGEWTKLIKTVYFGNQQAIAQLQSLVKANGLDLQLDKIAPSIAIGLVQKLNTAFEHSGDKAAIEDFAKRYNAIAGTLDSKQLKIFTSALTAMDWKNISNWEEFEQTLKDLGIELVDDVSNAFKALIKDGKNAAKAIRKIDIKTFADQYEKELDVINKMISGETKGIISAEDLEKLPEAIRNSFVQLRDGTYAFMGAAEDLRDRLLEDNAENSTAAYRKAVDNKIISDVLGQYDNVITETNIEKILTELQNRGVDLDQFENLIYNWRHGQNSWNIKRFDLFRDELTNRSNAASDFDIANSVRLKEYLLQSASFNGAQLLANINNLDGTNEDISRDDIITHSEALLSLAQLMGATPESIKNFSEALEKFKNGIDKTGEGLNEVTQGLANQIDKLIAINNLQMTAEQLNDLLDQFNSASGVQQWKIYLQIIQLLGLEMAESAEAANEQLSMVRKLIYGGSYEDYLEGIRQFTGIDGTERDINMKLQESEFQDKAQKGVSLGIIQEELINGQTVERILSESEWSAINANGGLLGANSEQWENSYDWLYKINRDINEQLREREKLEDRYNQILEYENDNLFKVAGLLDDEREALYTRGQLSTNKLFTAKAEIDQLMRENPEFAKAYKDNTGFEAFDAAMGEQYEKWLDRVETLEDARQEAEDDKLDAINDLYELANRGKEEYLDLETRAMEAYVDLYTRQIDELSAINDAVNDGNQKLIDSMQSSINKLRQDRENEKTESELTDKQRRLNYLRMDTTGANATEILQLEKEINDATESYTDTLVDQAISQLQDDNQIAQRQREEQIEIANNQLQYAKDSGALWDAVGTIITEGIDKNGIREGTTLAKILGQAEGTEAMSELQKSSWSAELMSTAALAWLFNDQTLYNNTMKSIRELNGYEGAPAGTYTTDQYSMANAGSAFSENQWKAMKDWFSGATGEPYLAKIAQRLGTGDDKDNEVDKADITAGEVNVVMVPTRSSLKSSEPNMIYFEAFATGGLNTTTGPAWLDGTPSKPELVLNAQDTQNFLALTDVLRHLPDGSTSSNLGNNYYEIQIDVDSINSDYSVDQVANRIKKLITDDANYRNVHAAGNLR